MADSYPIRFLRDVSGNNTPTDALLTVFGGEVLAAHNRTTQFLSRVNQRTVKPGALTEQFPETWRIGTERHEAGTELLGLDVETHLRTITLDKRPLVSHFDIDDIDEMLSEYSTRAEFSSKMGEALTNGADRRCAMLLVKASQDAGNGSLPGGYEQTVTNTNLFTAAGASALLGAYDNQVQYWDENDVPRGTRYAAVKWGMYHALRKLDSVAESAAGTIVAEDPFFTRVGGDNITQTAPPMLMYNGIQIFGTNNIPSETVVDDGDETNYVGTYTNTQSIIWQQDAVGWLTKPGLGIETARDVRRGTDFFKAGMLFGGGTLRPEAAGSIKHTA